jgi:hypothetical protein
LVGFGYFGVNYVIEEIQNVLVGNINIDHDLLVVEFIEREEGKLTLSNRIEIYDEKHTLAYTYNVRLMDFMTIEDSQLLVTTDSEHILVVSYDLVLLTTTNQAVDVVIALNTEYEFSPGEQLTFTLTFSLENYSPTIQQTPEEPKEPVFYNMAYSDTGSNKTFTDRDLEFNIVSVHTNSVSVGGGSGNLKFNADKGQVQIIVSPSLTNISIILELNGDEILRQGFTDTSQKLINIDIEEDGSILVIRAQGGLSVRLTIHSLLYTPE